MLKMVGNSGQLSLGKQYAGRYFEVEQREDGSIVLTPMRVIPECDAWLYTAETRERLRAADDWMDRNPPAETDLDALAEKLDNEAQ
ncbi:hypothetical protein CKO31_16495 [Thiohalocapsa halophila]|uniref:AbrB/MazE/SpoVT family DNA-binding domain-containing protein n=1 Tax=Thiohalocapsa halophila TaxID=69359 RepID=A0ABS1CKE5_9GAMM|nr:hypothetical protein [Thiohalocapsa halophila]MBK1632307.1 hypothetical protein [Thiohalocapsa halophila]